MVREQGEFGVLIFLYIYILLNADIFVSLFYEGRINLQRVIQQARQTLSLVQTVDPLDSDCEGLRRKMGSPPAISGGSKTNASFSDIFGNNHYFQIIFGHGSVIRSKLHCIWFSLYLHSP